jgi:hypothetical protein
MENHGSARCTGDQNFLNSGFSMLRTNRLWAIAGVAVFVARASWTHRANADTDKLGSKHIKHVLLLSIDGMHAVDFYNCANGIAGVNGRYPYCPNLAALGETGSTILPPFRRSPRTGFLGSRQAVGVGQIFYGPTAGSELQGWRSGSRSRSALPGHHRDAQRGRNLHRPRFGPRRSWWLWP